MAKPVNPDVKQVALEVLGHCFDEATASICSIDDYLGWVNTEYGTMSDSEAEVYRADVLNFIEAVLEGEITMRKPKR